MDKAIKKPVPPFYITSMERGHRIRIDERESGVTFTVQEYSPKEVDENGLKSLWKTIATFNVMRQ